MFEFQWLSWRFYNSCELFAWISIQPTGRFCQCDLQLQ